MTGCENSDVDTIALLGGSPAFSEPVPVGQLYFPSWQDYERKFKALFDRQYYTNHGPLVSELEASLAEYLSVRHAICVTNATIGLSMVAEGLNLEGRVALPAFTFIATPQSLLWCNLQPAFCDVNPDTHHLDLDNLAWLAKRDVSALCLTNLWGGACEVDRVQQIGRDSRKPVFFDSAQAFGCATEGYMLGRFGDAEVFSFHATKVLSATEGGCITTNDNDLAERLRNIRSSYGARLPVSVKRTANGRMSEAQAAIALMSLETLDANISRNRQLHECYQRHLENIRGIKMLLPQRVEKSNYQYAVCEVDSEVFGLSRDNLHRALHAENIASRRYFKPGAHRSPPFDTLFPEFLNALSNTDHLCEITLQLPLGARVEAADVLRICERIRAIQCHAQKINDAIGDAP